MCSLEGKERSWFAARFTYFQIHDRGTGNEQAARQSLEAELQPCSSEKFRPFINTVTYATVLSGFAFAEHDKEQLSA